MKNAVLLHLCMGACLVACRPEKTTNDVDVNSSVETKKEDVTVVNPTPTAAEVQNPETASAADAMKEITVSAETVLPGTSVTRNGESLKLAGTPLEVGKPLPELQLKNAMNGEIIHTGTMKGKVLLLSVVPAVETRVCSAQCHYLESQGNDLGENIVRITISRDSAEQLQKFAQNEETTNVLYASDKESGTFGTQTGLGIDGQDILARSVIVVDTEGIVRYVQVVPEITQLPDMEKAFQLTKNLTSEHNANSEKAPAQTEKSAM